MSNIVLAVFAAIGGLGGLGGLGALFYVRATGKKITAEGKKIGIEADDILSGRALEMYDRVSTEASDAKKDARECQDRMDALEDHVNILNNQVRQLGGNPPPFRYPILNVSDPT